MKRSLAWSWLIGAALYAVSTWLSADGVLVLGTALAAERASLSGDELRKAVSGKTVYLKISGFELPIRCGVFASDRCIGSPLETYGFNLHIIHPWNHGRPKAHK
jgi:hypothetical protein